MGRNGEIFEVVKDLVGGVDVLNFVKDNVMLRKVNIEDFEENRDNLFDVFV